MACLLKCTLIYLIWASSLAWAYPSFNELQQNEDTEDYQVHARQVAGSSLLFLAPHGGNIEYFTDELAEHLAENQFSLYTFKGRRSTNPRRLHITSSRFDEPQALSLAAKHSICIALHGYASRPEVGNSPICLGGRNKELLHSLHSSLIAAGLHDSPLRPNPCGRFHGTHPMNIVNRCLNQGVQIELSGDFRYQLKANPQSLDAFKNAIHEGIDNYLRRRPMCSPLLSRKSNS